MEGTIIDESGQLKYIHKVNRMHVNLSKTVYRLGTYMQQREKQSFILEPEAAPEGLLARKSTHVSESG
ncbi:hypothetical protein TELCIR_06357 [Teladorsagia circumcincta]|uniref:Uncharacterized protein n=1 Tax=Teladorsagia circumcincta TaxID=45464 RepID=A0A2G9UNC9_TELCI|nr:hypothetical protein TELCIR_06357 [Teladorsagia circumcincta]